VAPGLESLALTEALALGLPAEPAAGGGGIEWRGDLASVLRANLGLRIASRVLVRVAEFEATSFAALEREARRIDWGQVVPAGATVRFRVTCRKSRLYHSDAVAQRVGDAIVRALPGTKAVGASGPARGPAGGPAGEDEDDDAQSRHDDQLIVVRFVHDRCTVSADASGALLHRRGWRLQTGKAPMRETLAAALLAASRWNATTPLIDPFCGSGTIPIEAVQLANGIAPGLARSFAVERWPMLNAKVAAHERARFQTSVASGAPGQVWGFDRDAGAIQSSIANAERAGVDRSVTFRAQSISALTLPRGTPGWVVSNPPYGVRVGDAERVRDLWARLGSVLRERASGWQVALLSPGPVLERQLGIATTVAASTVNGGIPVRIVVGQVP
jgi:putative N6-adenine-specific DNA methylase